MTITVKLSDQIRLNNSTKDFILFDYDNNNKLTSYQLSNNLEYRNRFKTFRVLNIFKTQINKPLTIKL
jgi:hypothetical protein